MNVPQYTTPSFVCQFADENLDLTQASEVVVTFEAGTRMQIEKTGSELSISPKEVSFDLTQEETAMLTIGDVMLMVNWIFPNGRRGASKRKMINIVDNLHRAVM